MLQQVGGPWPEGLERFRVPLLMAFWLKTGHNFITSLCLTALICLPCFCLHYHSQSKHERTSLTLCSIDINVMCTIFFLFCLLSNLSGRILFYYKKSTWCNSLIFYCIGFCPKGFWLIKILHEASILLSMCHLSHMLEFLFN